MKQTIELGKVDYDNRGRKENRVTVDIKLENGNLSICGYIWDARNYDCVSCGQNLDTIGKLFPNDTRVQRIVAVWSKWHLNDMKAGSPAQTAHLETLTFPGHPQSHYDWVTSELSKVGLQPDPNYIHNGKPYSYGSAWLRVELPSEVVAEVESWLHLVAA